MPALRHWASVATEIDGDGDLPDGSPVAAAAVLLWAVVGGEGIEATRGDAALADQLDRVGSPYRAVAVTSRGERSRSWEGTSKHANVSRRARC